MSFLDEVKALTQKSEIMYYENAKNQIRDQITKNPTNTVWGIYLRGRFDTVQLAAVKNMFEKDGFIRFLCIITINIITIVIIRGNQV
jgi:hypothetical protein